MISKRKYQYGGAAPQGEGGIMQKIAQLPQDQQQQIMQAFASWAEQKGLDINQIQNNPDAMEQAMTQFLQEMQQSQAQAARHGAKLQYIKDLKGTCPDGTHLEYYKAGGRLCKKCMKNQEGGEMEQEKKGGVLAQYKDKVKKDCGGAKMKAGCGAKMKKHQIGGTIETLRQSLGLEKKKVIKNQIGGKAMFDRKAYADSVNNRNREMAKVYATSTPSISNLSKAAYYAYKGWIDPATAAQTGTVPVPSRIGKLPSQHPGGVRYSTPTLKDIVNNIKRTGQHGLPVNPEVGISLNTLVKYTGKSPEQIIKVMTPRYGDIGIERLPSGEKFALWRIDGDKDQVLNEVLELLK